MKTILNIETGEIIERELNKDELAQQTKDELIFKERESKKVEIEIKKESAKAKLAALGLTVDDLHALGI